jgi:pyruvate dehydrogenase E2 component (dihydrolipoamide acetyltransferase)
MPVYFSMPKLGLNMTQGVIVRWLVGEGDQVEAGKPVLEIETDKATQELEAPGTGILARILKNVGDVVPCNDVIAVILAPGETMPASIPATIGDGIAQKIELTLQPSANEAPQAVETSSEETRINISPVARALAEELGVDISKIVPRGGRIKREDVLAAHEAQKSQPSKAPISEIRTAGPSLRKKIAEHMSQSARTVARVGLTLEADARLLVEWRNRSKTSENQVSYNILLAKIVAKALQEFPYMNSQWINDEVIQNPEINIGIAVDTDRGLVVPVLKSVNQKDVNTLQQELNAASQRALRGRSLVSDFEGGTFTITNLGSSEIESFLPIINVPECAILAVGAIQRKPVVNDAGDGILIRPRLTLTLAFDHRLTDGGPAAKFLQRIKHLIEAGEVN